ncbi:MAG: hypothetical protein ACE5GG_00380 [Candidatus Omnitrophota bacterium]
MTTSDRNSHVTTHISRLKKAQSILEYVIVLTAIVAAVILGAGAVKDKLYKAADADGQGGGGLISGAADTITEFTGTLPGN